ncbi:interferon-induced protein with tetratricopeptide repeats 1-like [Solea solea]|uniref:interferon-induced protein with tetratricopeptide repeats 1-like n=1 Tax=Solea solea TaxID=90069 RepID=UPI00272BC65E|nr:interferon-induced protein with tetratricopeptide repeats 1-like [Solea solea]
MMSSAQRERVLEAKLEALQCHFTWDVDFSRSKLLRIRDKLQDIGTEEGYSWLGHIYNLQGYIHFQLGFTTGARRFFSRAAEAFRQIRNTVTDEGPWLVVNYSNLAWLNYHEGERAESQACLLKVEGLMREYPSPWQGELHPEIYAEKAWTLMKYSRDHKLLAADYFQRAIRMQPDMKEWQTSHMLAVVNAFKHSNNKVRADILDKMKIAKDHDPENLYLAALYLEACATNEQNIVEEACALAHRVLIKPVSSYSGIKPLLRLYRTYVSMDEAIDLAEGALERHPDERYLKKCAAVCYKMRILLHRDTPVEQSMVERAISLYREVISTYPDSSLKSKISLATIYAHSNHSPTAAEQIYKELLDSDMDPNAAQMVYNFYAKHLHLFQKESYRSIEFHMRAAAIPQLSFFRENSISILERIRDRNRNRMCGEIAEFLADLKL